MYHKFTNIEIKQGLYKGGIIMEKGVLVCGSLNFDISVYTPKLPLEGQTLLGSDVSFTAGGKGGNQAVGVRCAGSDSYMVACIGQDSNGETLKKSLEQYGVDTSGLLEVDTPTGMSLLTVDKDGKNTIIVVPGANFTLDSEVVLKNASLFSKTNVTLLQNEIPIQTNDFIMEQAKKAKHTILYNSAPFHELSSSQLSMIDFILPNETELADLVPGNQSYEEKAKALLRQGVKNVVVTLGDEGALLVENSGKTTAVKTPKVDVVSTVGAGDCLCGYFAAGISQGKAPLAALETAVYAASMSVGRFGAQSSIPLLEEVMLAKGSF